MLDPSYGPDRTRTRVRWGNIPALAGLAYSLGHKLQVALDTRTVGVGLCRETASGELWRTHVLGVEEVRRAGGDGGTTVPQPVFEGRSISTSQHKVRGQLTVNEPDGRALHLGECVALDVELELVSVGHELLADGSLLRMHVWKSTAAPAVTHDDVDEREARSRVAEAVADVRLPGLGPGPGPGPGAGAGAGAGALLLDLYRQLEPDLDLRMTRCPHRPELQMVDVTTGYVIPAGCWRLSCPRCVRVLARRRAWAIGLARPTHLMLLTNTGATGREAASSLRRFSRAARRHQPRMQFAAHVEPSEGQQSHVHLWVHSIDADDGWVQDAAERVGVGTVSGLEARRAPDGAPLAYGMKMVLDEDPTSSQLSLTASTYLALNGGKLSTTTRRFFRMADGTPIPAVRTAEKVASQRIPRVWRTTTEPQPPTMDAGRPSSHRST